MSKETTLRRVLTRKTALQETRIEQLPVLPLQDGERCSRSAASR